MEALRLFIFACLVLQQTQGYVLMPAGLAHPAFPAGSGVFTPAQIQSPGKSLVDASHSEVSSYFAIWHKFGSKTMQIRKVLQSI